MGPLALMACGSLDHITPEAVGRLILGGISILTDADAAKNADAVLNLCRAFAALNGRPEMTDAELGAALGPFLNAALAEENERLRADIAQRDQIAAEVMAHFEGITEPAQVKRDPDPTAPGAPGERVERRG